ncbi:outer-membrane lipoprotein carrier protein LolA [Candidatus Thioglobus autotrophicus]|uniref:LolA family protein n=1 Tax=Candidatus Thioglobus autotrophicus TaxID=1705394 RepID=UPI00299D473C|nr:outer-membrane lipoprotein carrier protein LolA [Candidatus Thioglobus autotrophicus]WPE16518.1 outer-membrane lipoprotein carrier protein LolA [Candidatus Thioglobus autotrophicus]
MANFLGALTLCFCSIAMANNEFEAFFSSLETLSADFTQQTYNDANIPISKTSGYLRFERPASFIWQTNSPIEQTLLLHNQELWLVDTELEQASQRAISELKGTPLYWLINRPEQLKNLPKYTHSKLGVNWYQTQQSNQLSFGFRNNSLHALRLTNTLGQNIQVVFSEMILNPNLEKNTFALDLTNDFDIIRSF